MHWRIIAGLLSPVMWGGCVDKDLRLRASQGDEGEITERLTKVDILVMMERSPTTVDEQTMLAEHFPAIIRKLMASTEGQLSPVTDLRVGVISQDLGTNGVDVGLCQDGLWGFDGGDRGCLLAGPPGTTCPGMETRRWLEQNEETAHYTLDEMARDFACIAQLGPNGCGFEQQLESVRMALVDQTAPGGCNEGFLRPDSVLAIVVVSDEEECSVANPDIFDRTAPGLPPSLSRRCFHAQHLLIPVDRLVEGLNAIRGPRGSPTVVAMIVGVPIGPPCEGRGNEIGGCLDLPEMGYPPETGENEVGTACARTLPDGVITSAAPARRFVEVAQRLGDRALVRSICNADWRPVMDALFELVQEKLRGDQAERNAGSDR